MKKILFVLLAASSFFLQGCASTDEGMDPVRYERAVQKDFDENYEERLKY